jgi:hypothetical protein
LESRRLEQDMKFLKDSRQGMIEQIRAFCKAQLATLDGLDRPERSRDTTRQAVVPRPAEVVQPPRPPAPAPTPAPAVSLTERLERAVSGASEAPLPKAPRAWQPERVERDEVDAKISEALVVDESAVAYPPPLVPQSRPQGDR